MKKITLIIIPAIFSFAAFAATDNDPVVATVNEAKLNKSLLENSFKQNMLFVSERSLSKEKTLEDLINRELGIQKAKKSKLDQDDMVRMKMEDVLYHAQVSKDLEPGLKAIKVSDEDVKEYYKENQEYRTAHILLRVRSQPEKAEYEAAQKRAFELYDALKKTPDKFAEFSNKNSQSSNAPTGGDMGFQPSVRLAPEYYQAIKGKQKGYISPPVRTLFGYHIIKVLGVKAYNEIDMSLYKKIIFDKKRDKLIEEYFAGLRKGAQISIDKAQLK